MFLNNTSFHNEKILGNDEKIQLPSIKKLTTVRIATCRSQKTLFLNDYKENINYKEQYIRRQISLYKKLR